MRRSARVLFLSLLVPAMLWGQGIEVSVDRTEVTIEDLIQMSVTIEGSQSAEPILPPLDDFDVRYLGPRSEIQVVNGRVTRRITHVYSLAPKREGLLTVASASVEIEDRSYSSRAFQIRVLPESERPRDERRAFVSVSVSTREPWIGQQVLYIWRFYRVPGSAGNAQLVSQDFGDLLVENLGDVREFRTTRGGREYEVSEIRRALFAQAAGPTTIPPSELRVDVVVEDPRAGRRRGLFDDLFGGVQTESKLLRSRPVELDVRALPSPPEGFSGLVGEFELSSSLSRLELELGDSVTQTLEIRGVGSVLMIPEPRSTLDEAEFKVYPEPPNLVLDRGSEGLSARKTFERALVPLRAGELTVPEARLSYFDPDTGLYSEVVAEPSVLVVAESSTPEDLGLRAGGGLGKARVSVLDDGLLPIHRGLSGIGGRAWIRRLQGVLIGLPPLLFFGLTALRRWKAGNQSDDPGLRRRRALREAIRTLRSDEAFAGPTGAVEADRVLVRYLGDRLGSKGGAMTPLECRSLLEDHRLDPELVERTVDLLVRADAARYSRGDTGVVTPVEELERLLREIERGLS